LDWDSGVGYSVSRGCSPVQRRGLAREIARDIGAHVAGLREVEESL